MLVTGNITDAKKQIFLITDNEVITEITTIPPPLALLAAYYTYNIQYPKGCLNFYSLIEVLFIKKARTSVTASVKHILCDLADLID